MMDDKAFITSFAAKETVRINESLKKLIERTDTPSEEEKNAVIADIETTLRRLQSAISHIATEEDNHD